ncbi:MAG: CvpA family protein [Thermodesulfobacteriota bacterium]|nr:CvpA family protein [Thermodesulfobacteriota bacterium]
MNIIDMVIIAVLCFTTIRGIFRGLSSELASIIGLLGAFYAAFLFYPRVVAMLPEHIPRGTFADIVGFTLIFLSVFIMISVLGLLIKFALCITMLGWIDRILGAAFGALKGIIFVSVLLFIITSLGSSSIPAVERSVLCGYAAIFSDAMADAVPERMPENVLDLLPDGLEKQVKQLKENIWN